MKNLIRQIIWVPVLIALLSFRQYMTFEEQQKSSFNRVKTAYEHVEEKVNAYAAAKDIDASFTEILIRVFKQEKELEIWGAGKQGKYVKLHTYKICAASGKLGPKRKQGDQQVPEGFYVVKVFNPMSNYYLSLGINYPNQADSIKSKAEDKGGDIYIHGDCASIGCLAMTDDLIEEIYVMAVKAKSKGQTEIPVHIFPFKMTEKNESRYMTPETNKALVKFWNNLKTGYNYFQNKKMLPQVSVDKQGWYLFK